MAPHTSWVGQGVTGYGDAPSLGGPGGWTVNTPTVGMAAPDDHGYWVTSADGGVFSFGDAGFHGSLGADIHLYAPIVGMASTPDGGGYWLVAMDGGVFTFGDAGFFGSIGGTTPPDPVVAMAVTPDGRGYWLAAAGGEIYTFGDAVNYGSVSGENLRGSIVSIVRTGDGKGYWLVGLDGGVFTFGDAGFFGSAANSNINAAVVGLAPTADGAGYWLAAATGGVLTYGDAVFHGPSPNNPPFSPTSAIVATSDGGGYWLLRPDETAVSFSNPPASSPAFPAGASAVSWASSQVGPNPDAFQGNYCNPYGPCEEWCALFATWVWNQAGIAIPHFAFTGDVYNWSKANGRVLPPTATPNPGDGVMYGTGPQNTSTSVHIGIVAQVWPDGAIDTIEGDSGPEPAGQYAVTYGGPYLPAASNKVNEIPVYGYAQP
jgi:hypothetical protein